MVTAESVNIQLKKLGFNVNAFSNRAEQRELPNILIPDEEIFECVNGYYEGGSALLVATNIRVILVDKKPLNFLTVEDLRFDMINQMDYSHRLFGADISISVGSKNLKFKSYNKTRLRKLINHVQHCIADLKKQQSQHQQGQNQHLEQINQQLQTYLLAQYQSQIVLNQRLQESQAASPTLPTVPIGRLVQPSPELADYLFAQSLLRQYKQQQTSKSIPDTLSSQVIDQDTAPEEATAAPIRPVDLYDEGRREIFSKYRAQQVNSPADVDQGGVTQSDQAAESASSSSDINSLQIAYAKLPMALRYRRRFGRSQSLNRNRVLPVIPV
jgi:hypothetical protein